MISKSVLLLSYLQIFCAKCRQGKDDIHFRRFSWPGRGSRAATPLRRVHSTQKEQGSLPATPTITPIPPITPHREGEALFVLSCSLSKSIWLFFSLQYVIESEQNNIHSESNRLVEMRRTQTQLDSQKFWTDGSRYGSDPLTQYSSYRSMYN